MYTLGFYSSIEVDNPIVRKPISIKSLLLYQNSFLSLERVFLSLERVFLSLKRVFLSLKRVFL